MSVLAWQRNTGEETVCSVVLTFVDRFQKMVQYVPLVKLPSATETADLLALHVFWLHGLPANIVSDQDPQFTSRVWQMFCKAFGTTSSLTLGLTDIRRE